MPVVELLGEKNLADGKVEIRRRTEEKASTVELARAVGETVKLVSDCRVQIAD